MSYEIKTGFEHMNLPAIHHFLSKESYWAGNISFETVEQSLKHSFCIGIFIHNEQIGFARLITDYTSFAYLADVYILSAHRRKGLSKILIQHILDLQWVKKLKRILLSTIGAHTLYSQFGFTASEHPERLMEKRLST